MQSALSAGLYNISAMTNTSLTLWVNSTLALTPPTHVQGMINSSESSIWNVTQPANKGGLWSIKETTSGLHFGYNTSEPNVSTPIMAVKEEILWDILPADIIGYHQLIVPKTNLTATLASGKVVSLYLSGTVVTNGIDSERRQSLAFGLMEPIVKSMVPHTLKSVPTSSSTSQPTLQSVTGTPVQPTSTPMVVVSVTLPALPAVVTDPLIGVVTGAVIPTSNAPAGIVPMI